MLSDRRLRLALLFFLVAAAWWIFWSRRASHEASLNVAESIREGRRVGVLVISPDEQEAVDAAVLISYEPLSGTAVLFHVPPTLCIDAGLEDSTTARGRLPTTLEAAYARESLAGVRVKLQRLFGPELALVTVLPARNFLRLIDLMGGVFVNVPDRISFRRADDSRNTAVPEWIEIPKGEEVFLDSDKTKMYLSYKYDGLGSKGQMFRARRLALAFFGRMGLHLEHGWFIRELTGAFSGPPADVLVPLCEALGKMPSASLDVQVLPGKTDVNAGVFWMSGRDLDRSLPRAMRPLAVMAAPKSRITVQILNGSGVPNAAVGLREKLTAFPDVDVVEMGNAGRFDHEETLIIDRAGHVPSAERIRGLIGAGVLRQDVNLKAMVDVTVIIGKDALK